MSDSHKNKEFSLNVESLMAVGAIYNSITSSTPSKNSRLAWTRRASSRTFQYILCWLNITHHQRIHRSHNNNSRLIDSAKTDDCKAHLGFISDDTQPTEHFSTTLSSLDCQDHFVNWNFKFSRSFNANSSDNSDLHQFAE